MGIKQKLTMSSSDVSDIEEEKKKMAQEKKPKKNLSDSEENDSEAEKAKAKKKRKKEEKKKRKKKEESDSGSDSEEENKKKKKKKKKNKEEVEDGVELDDEGRVDLGRLKLVDVREFKGKLLIDTREFYNDKDGEKKPGRKDISLSTVEWENLKRAIPYIDRKIKKMS